MNNQSDAQSLYKSLQETHQNDTFVFKYLSYKDLREMIDLAKKEGFMLGHKIGMEHGEAKGEQNTLDKIDREIRSNLFRGIEIIVKYGYVVMKYVAENFKEIEILSYKINYLPSQHGASVLFLVKCATEDEFNFSKVLDLFEGFASQYDGFAVEANFVNVRDKETDYQLIQFDYPKSLDLAFVKDAFAEPAK